jgi:hypothetical protein
MLVVAVFGLFPILFTAALASVVSLLIHFAVAVFFLLLNLPRSAAWSGVRFCCFCFSSPCKFQSCPAARARPYFSLVSLGFCCSLLSRQVFLSRLVFRPSASRRAKEPSFSSFASKHRFLAAVWSVRAPASVWPSWT